MDKNLYNELLGEAEEELKKKEKKTKTKTSSKKKKEPAEPKQVKSKPKKTKTVKNPVTSTEPKKTVTKAKDVVAMGAPKFPQGQAIERPTTAQQALAGMGIKPEPFPWSTYPAKQQFSWQGGPKGTSFDQFQPQNQPDVTQAPIKNIGYDQFQPQIPPEEEFDLPIANQPAQALPPELNPTYPYTVLGSPGEFRPMPISNVPNVPYAPPETFTGTEVPQQGPEGPFIDQKFATTGQVGTGEVVPPPAMNVAPQTPYREPAPPKEPEEDPTIKDREKGAPGKEKTEPYKGGPKFDQFSPEQPDSVDEINPTLYSPAMSKSVGQKKGTLDKFGDFIGKLASNFKSAITPQAKQAVKQSGIGDPDDPNFVYDFGKNVKIQAVSRQGGKPLNIANDPMMRRMAIVALADDSLGGKPLPELGNILRNLKLKNMKN